MSDIPDALREAPLSFDQWLKTFEVPSTEKEERLAVARAAAQLLKNPAFKRVLAKLEADAIKALVNLPLAAGEKLHEYKMLAYGVRKVREAVQSLAQEVEMAEKQSQIKAKRAQRQ